MILQELIDGVAILTLNNPAKRNALSSEVLIELKARLNAIEKNTDVRVVVLRAEGNVFSAGHDLSELTKADVEASREIFGLCTDVMESIRLLPQPVIAEVNGLATAAGCQLVASCDMAVASEEARFATPGVNIGLFCTTPGVALSRSISPKKAMEMLLTGIPISAYEALQHGLVNKVVPLRELSSHCMELARHIAKASSLVVKLGKQAFYRQLELDRPKAYDVAQAVMVDNLKVPDAQEGIKAFLEKRDPVWSNE